MADKSEAKYQELESTKGGKPTQDEIKRVNEYQDEQRASFIRKVYIILLVQLTFTCIMCYVAMTTDAIKQNLMVNMWRFWVACGIVIVQSIFMCICKCIVTKCPFNIISLITFTILQTYIVATTSTFFPNEIVFVAAAIVLAGVAAATIYSCIFAREVRTSSAVVFLLVVNAIGVGASFLVWPDFIIYSAIVGLVCFGISFYLVTHTKTLAYDPDLDTLQEGGDDYIYGALKLYLDVILIFITVLNCIKAIKSKFSPA